MDIVIVLLIAAGLILGICKLIGIDVSGQRVPRSDYKKYFVEDIWEERKNGK